MKVRSSVILKSLLGLVIALLGFEYGLHPVYAIELNSHSSHPRLLLHEGQEKEILNIVSQDKDIRRVHDFIVSESDSIISKPLLDYKKTGFRLLSVSREALKRILYLSYSYRMTGEPKYSRRAIKEMINVCEFDDWNPAHYLDVAEMVMGVAIGYDWLYDDLNPTEKQIIVESIIRKAFDPASNNEFVGFYNLSNNWNQVCNSALINASIAIMDENPDVAHKMIEKSVKSNSLGLTQYGEDGGYPEGYGYWSYGTTYQTLLIDALRNNSDYTLDHEGHEGFLRTPYFKQFMEAPSKLCFDFGDTPRKASNSIAMWWFADYLEDSTILFSEREYLKNGVSDISLPWLLPVLPIYASRLNSNPTYAPDNHFWFNKGKTPLFIYRDNWLDSKSTYLGIKGGSASTSHSHMDAGSFIYESAGIRWADDLGGVDYNKIESSGLNLWDGRQNGDRWKVMRIRNDVHNTITIDSARHKVKGYAHIIKVYMEDDKKGAEVDMTSTLGQPSRAIRKIFLDEENSLHVIDSLVTDKQVLDFSWTMVTSADVTLKDPTTMLLQQDGETLQLTVDALLPVKPYIVKNTPEHSYDAPNWNSKRIGFTCELPRYSSNVIEVTLSPM